MSTSVLVRARRVAGLVDDLVVDVMRAGDVAELVAHVTEAEHAAVAGRPVGGLAIPRRSSAKRRRAPRPAALTA